MDKNNLVQQAYEVFQVIEADQTFPNNALLPLIIYKGALLILPGDDVNVIETLFKRNGWSNSWVDGIFNYHHYHSNTHEVMGVYSGKADVQMGGPNGGFIELNRGDVLIIPAGVAHKCLKCSDDFKVLGAYPEGFTYDMNYGNEGERPKADHNIALVPIPAKDPVYGADGPLKYNWSKNNPASGDDENM
ncbi:MAG: cupin domain-containing protein [Flavobacterium sp.]|nr:cupin domain-containing protein [Pedobacter sp.]